MTGRSAPSSRSSARSTSPGAAPDSGGRPPTGSAPPGAGSANTLSGTSRFTGPGRPDSVAASACGSITGSWSVLVTWKARLTYGRTAPGKSAW